MKTYNQTKILFLSIFCFSIIACKKDFLEEKPDNKLVIPTTLKDGQALLDHTLFNSSQPALGNVGSDSYYLSQPVFQGLTVPQYQNAYIWNQEIFQGFTSTEWNGPYQRIFYANAALALVEKINPSPNEQVQFNTVKGSAFFHRAYAYHCLATIFTGQYNAATALNELGLPLKLSADINEAPGRSNLKDVYNLIVDDLQKSLRLLPDFAAYKTRPSKWAAYGMLARVYLTMQEYNKAYLYADSCLALNNTLQDLNDISITGTLPSLNKDVIFHSQFNLATPLLGTNAIIDDNLYASYSLNDLRKSIYFNVANSIVRPKFPYSSSATLHFGGLVTDEIYLIRAESNARSGNIGAAMKDLNDLLRTRWKKTNNVSSYVDQTATDEKIALQLILSERRKEMPFRGTRWTDLKRLNLSDDFKTVLTRTIGNTIYTLLPNSNKYTLPIPPDEILASGIVQNPR